VLKDIHIPESITLQPSTNINIQIKNMQNSVNIYNNTTSNQKRVILEDNFQNPQPGSLEMFLNKQKSNIKKKSKKKEKEEKEEKPTTTVNSDQKSKKPRTSNKKKPIKNRKDDDNATPDLFDLSKYIFIKDTQVLNLNNNNN
jgi:hypothetical protein